MTLKIDFLGNLLLKFKRVISVVVKLAKTYSQNKIFKCEDLCLGQVLFIEVERFSVSMEIEKGLLQRS